MVSRITLDNLRQIVLKYRLTPILISFVFLAIVAVILYQARGVPDPAELNPVFETDPLGGGVDLSALGLPTGLPNQSQVYSITEAQNLSTESVSSIARAFGFTGNPERVTDDGGITYLYSAGGKALVFYPAPGGIQYTEPGFSAQFYTTSGQLPSQEKAITIADEYLAKFNLSPGSLTEPSINYLLFTNEEVLLPSSEEDATYLEVQYKYLVGGLELISRPAVLTILIDRKNAVVSANYFPPPTVNLVREVELMTLAEVLPQLQEIGQVFQIRGEEFVPETDTTFLVTRFRPETVSLVLIEVSGGIVEPAYLFQGIGYITNEVVNAAVITPAIFSNR